MFYIGIDISVFKHFMPIISLDVKIVVNHFFWKFSSRFCEINWRNWKFLRLLNCSRIYWALTQYSFLLYLLNEVHFICFYGKIFEKGTKTEHGERVNYISDTTVQILKKYQKQQLKQKLLLGSKWQCRKRIFTTKYGADIHPDTPTKILDQVIKNYFSWTTTY